MGDRPMIPVVWLGAHPLCWDQGMVDAALSGRLWPTGYGFKHAEAPDLDQAVAFADRGVQVWDGGVFVVPGAAFAAQAQRVNDLVNRFSWAFVLVTSDEERRFPLDALDHPNMAVWVQYPRSEDQADGFLPVGWPGHFPPLLSGRDQRDHPWVFAGQVNHRRRKELAEVLRRLDDGVLIESPGFTQGLDHREYAALLASAEVVPCPSGPESVDSFRVWETLEAGAVPVADSVCPAVGESAWLWRQVLDDDPPFPVIGDWADFPDVVADRPRVSAWWSGWKREWCQRIGATVHRLSGVEPEPEPVTVLIPTSPIAAHPDTSIIEETIASVRFWHPSAEIVVMCDGVRAEQEHYRDRYERYLEQLTWLAARDGRILPVIHDEHLHQVGMTRRALDLVSSAVVLFVEHDCPLVMDEPIDWPPLIDVVRSGEADLVRFHYEAGVHPEHEHLMLDEKPRDVRGAPLLRTVQWSQRPHLANTGFYRRVLANDVLEGHVGMIEDVLHSVVQTAWRDFGPAGWDRYRLWMYAPEGNLKRSLHLDARGADQKWVDS